MEDKNVLTYEGLQYYDQKIKEYITEGDDDSKSYADGLEPSAITNEELDAMCV